jgi:hypothetical protein
MDVAAYLHNRPAQWLVIPDLRSELGSKYEKYDEGSIGQLDTRILTEQYADESAAKDMAEAWRGGAYYAAGNKDPKRTGTAKIGLLYLSRWNADDSADAYAKIYSDYLPQRYSSVRKVAHKDSACADSECKTSYFFETEEGPVSIVRIEGAGVLVCEGFDFDLASKLEQKLLTANPAKTVQVKLRSLMSPLRTSAVIREAVGRMVVADIEKSGSQHGNALELYSRLDKLILGGSPRLASGALTQKKETRGMFMIPFPASQGKRRSTGWSIPLVQ